MKTLFISLIVFLAFISLTQSEPLDHINRSPAVLNPGVVDDDPGIINDESDGIFDGDDEDTAVAGSNSLSSTGSDEIKLSSAKNSTSPYQVWSDIPDQESGDQ